MSSEGAAGVAIRCSTAADLELLEALHRRIFTGPCDQPWTRQSFAEILAMPGANGLLLIADEVPLGFLISLLAVDQAEIVLTGVVPEARRLGHARRLVEEAIDRVRKRGATQMFLEYAADNIAAGELYRSLGFEPCGKRPDYYEGQGGLRGDAVVMMRRLQDLP